MLRGRSRFEVSVTGFDWVANHEKTRWFLVMRLDKAPQDGLNQLLRISNGVVQIFGQPPLYADSQPPPQANDPPGHKIRQRGLLKTASGSSSHAFPAQMAAVNHLDVSSSFHISIGWTLTAPSKSLVEKLDSASHDFKTVKVGINTVKAKIGNGITSMFLVSKIDTSNRIIEK